MTDAAEKALSCEASRRMMSYISPVYGGARRFMAIMDALGVEMQELCDLAVSLRAQAMPQTADWALPMWEAEYSLRAGSMDAQARRAQLLSRVRAFSAANPWAVCRRASVAVGRPVRALENTAPNRFTLYVNNYITDEAALRAAVDEIKPAHLTYEVRCETAAEVRAPAACAVRYARRVTLSGTGA